MAMLSAVRTRKIAAITTVFKVVWVVVVLSEQRVTRALSE